MTLREFLLHRVYETCIVCLMETDPPTNSPLSESVASEIRAEMGRRGVTQSILADRLDVHPLWVSRRLSAGSARRIAMTLDDLNRIAAVLDIDPGLLIERAMPREVTA